MLQVKIVYLGGSEQLLSPACGPIQDGTAMSRKVEPVIIKRDVIRSDHDFVSFGFFSILLEDAQTLCCLAPAGRFNAIFHDVCQNVRLNRH